MNMQLSAEQFLASPMAEWLQFERTERQDVFAMRFQMHHIGNPFIRALHGGAVGSFIEACAEIGLSTHVPDRSTELVSNTISYLRVTRDADLYGRFEIARIARRIAFVDVWCWQDDESVLVARGSCILRMLTSD